MTTQKQTATWAAQANAQGKILKRDENGTLILDESGQPIFEEYKPTAEETAASNQSIIKSLSDEAHNIVKVLELKEKHNRLKSGDAERLELWQLYLIDLDEVDTSLENMQLPEKPAS